MAMGIGKVDFVHCQREAKGVDHELPSFSYHDKISYLWDNDHPSCLLGKLVDDVNVA